MNYDEQHRICRELITSLMANRKANDVALVATALIQVIEALAKEVRQGHQ